VKDLFNSIISPMLIAENAVPFADDTYLYEIKWDGERCVAFLDPDDGTHPKWRDAPAGVQGTAGGQISDRM